jgi:hypothetical protein
MLPNPSNMEIAFSQFRIVLSIALNIAVDLSAPE